MLSPYPCLYLFFLFWEFYYNSVYWFVFLDCIPCGQKLSLPLTTNPTVIDTIRLETVFFTFPVSTLSTHPAMTRHCVLPQSRWKRHLFYFSIMFAGPPMGGVFPFSLCYCFPVSVPCLPRMGYLPTIHFIPHLIHNLVFSWHVLKFVTFTAISCVVLVVFFRAHSLDLGFSELNCWCYALFPCSLDPTFAELFVFCSPGAFRFVLHTCWHLFRAHVITFISLLYTGVEIFCLCHFFIIIPVHIVDLLSCSSWFKMFFSSRAY